MNATLLMALVARFAAQTELFPRTGCSLGTRPLPQPWDRPRREAAVARPPSRDLRGELPPPQDSRRETAAAGPPPRNRRNRTAAARPPPRDRCHGASECKTTAAGVRTSLLDSALWSREA
jgi:hypothetical protein